MTAADNHDTKGDAMNRTYTDPSVFAGVAAGATWADPETDPTRIDWPARQAAAAVPFRVVDGRPVNPSAPTGIRYGRNELGHWGEQQCADAVVTATTNAGRWLLLIERGDGHGWALPGGNVDPGEDTVAAALRELAEETGFAPPPGTATTREAPRVVPDPRQSDEAWMVTTPVKIALGEVEALPAVAGADDAARAEWVPAGSYATLVAHLATARDGVVFAAHRQLLLALLG